MSKPRAEQTVSEIASANLARTRILENFGIDYCCGGGIPLEEACRKQGISAQVVLSALLECDQSAQRIDDDFFSEGAVNLAEHILDRHHAYLWDELPRLDELHVQVCQHHAQEQPLLMKSLELFRDLRRELEQHMHKEEQVLFPLCKPLEQGHTDELGRALEILLASHEDEHRHVGETLDTLRRMHNGYRPTGGNCRRQQALISRLEALERDMHLHVHKENNMLFPMLRSLAAGQ